VCQFEFVLPWAGRGHRDFDPPHAHADQRADLQQLQPDRTTGCLSELRVGQPDATQGAEQHVSHRGKPQAELVGLHGRGRGAVGEQVELAFLDAVLHVAARAVGLLVEVPRACLAALERGDDEARIGLAAGHLGLADDPAFPAPRAERGVAEVLEAARRLASADTFDRRADQLRGDRLFQPVIAGQAEHVVHAVRLAPCHQWLAREAGITAQQNACPGPAAADLCHDASDLLHRAGRGVHVRAAQLRHQQMSAAEDVERQVTVAIVVAVEELAFLIPMQWIVGGIEIKDDLFRRLLMGIKEEIDEQRLDRGRVVAYLVITRRFGTAQFQPVER